MSDEPTEDLYAAGRARSKAGWDAVMQTPQEQADAPPGSYPDLSHSILMGDIWQRPGLTMREKRLIVLTLLAAYGRPEPMQYHLRGGLRSGDLDRESIDALVVQIAFYGGWPASSTLYTTAQEALADPTNYPSSDDSPPGHPDA